MEGVLVVKWTTEDNDEEHQLGSRDINEHERHIIEYNL